MKIDVAENQTVISLDVPPGTTIMDAINLAGLKINNNKVGIFGKIYELNHILKEGDRVEIYYPLLIDFKKNRFQKVKAARKKS